MRQPCKPVTLRRHVGLTRYRPPGSSRWRIGRSERLVPRSAEYLAGSSGCLPPGCGAPYPRSATRVRRRHHAVQRHLEGAAGPEEVGGLRGVIVPRRRRARGWRMAPTSNAAHGWSSPGGCAAPARPSDPLQDAGRCSASRTSCTPRRTSSLAGCSRRACVVSG